MVHIKHSLLFLSVFFSFFLTIPSLFSLINPNLLPPNWWEEINDGRRETELQELIHSLPAVIEKLSPEGKKSAEDELTLLGQNMAALSNLEKRSVPPFSKIPFANRPYSINESLELFEKLEQNRITLSTLSDEREERASQINSAQDKLDRLIDRYYRENEQTEERLLLGLKWVNLQTSLYAANLKLKEVDSLIQNSKDGVRELSLNLQYAIDHLEPAKEEEKKLEEEKVASEKLWQESLSDLKNSEAEKVSRPQTFTQDRIASNNELDNQELMQKTLSEALAKSHLFLIETKIALLHALSEGNENGLPTRDQLISTRSWKKELAIWQKRSLEWKNQAERQIQRTGAFLTFVPKEEGSFQVISREQQIIRIAQGNLFILQRLDSILVEIGFLLDVTEKKEAIRLGNARWIQEEVVATFKSAINKVENAFETTLFHLSGRPFTLFSLFELIVFLIIAAKVASFVAKTISGFLSTHKRIEKSLAYRVHRITYYLLIAIGTIIALSAVGVDVSSFLLVAGALGVGLGFGLQTIFNNFFSGILLLFESHIKVGDYIEISSGAKGEVREINFRSTIISTGDGLEIIIPNSEIISGKVTNWTLKHPFRRIQVLFSTSYDADKEFVTKLISEEAAKMDSTLISLGFPPPQVILTKFGENGLEFELGAWVKERQSRNLSGTISEYLWMIDDLLKREGIVVPYPRYDVRIIEDDRKGDKGHNAL